MSVAPDAPSPRTTADPNSVLVVDDEPTVRMVARLMLERTGYAVAEAGAAAAALAQVRTAARPFVLVLMDVTLPDRPGTELVPELRSLAPESRVILTSGKGEDDF